MKRSPRFLLLALMLALAVPAGAQWSSDPAVNLPIADRPGEQVVPKIACTAGGACYVAWFDQASGNYDVYLQHLDPAGVEQWPHNGILVSGHAQNSWLVDWDLIADAAGNAVLVFTDIRDGSDLDVYAYKVAPDGQMLWDSDGVALSANDDYEPSPRVTEADDGDLVFVWPRLPDAGDGKIMMQRLSPAGAPRFPDGGLAVAGEPDEDPAFCDVVPAESGGVIVAWVKDISTFMSDRFVLAERFSAAGASVWGGPVSVFDATSVPIAYQPVLQSDGVGGALLCWHRSLSNYFNSFVQHLASDGSERFPHNGVAVSTRAGYHHIDPALSREPDTGDLYVFWDERNSNQSQWGIYGQRLTAGGVRTWGDQGRELLPVSTLYKLALRSLPAAGGAMAFYIDEPTGVYGQNRVMGFRVDDTGHFTWPDSPREVSSLLSGKSRLPVAMGDDGVAKLIWEDDRAGSVDVYGQNLNPDGSLGAGGTAVDGAPAAERPALGRNFPNPFNPKTSLRFDLPRPATVELAIFDASGRRVATLHAGPLPVGRHEVEWLGRADDGRALASGLYFARLSAAGTVLTRKMVLIK